MGKSEKISERLLELEDLICLKKREISIKNKKRGQLISWINNLSEVRRTDRRNYELMMDKLFKEQTILNDEIVILEKEYQELYDKNNKTKTKTKEEIK